MFISLHQESNKCTFKVQGFKKKKIRMNVCVMYIGLLRYLKIMLCDRK